MDRYVRNFIIMSVLYLALASVAGVGMMLSPWWQHLRFVHTHFMLIGWVTMMIYGVGYHILPRFAGKLIKSPLLGEIHFWVANIGLISMVVFYGLLQNAPENQAYVFAVAIAGVMQIVSSMLFFYNMFTVFFARKEETPAQG